MGGTGNKLATVATRMGIKISMGLGGERGGLGAGAISDGEYNGERSDRWIGMEVGFGGEEVGK